MARICPMEACSEEFPHGHGGDEHFLPRPPSAGPVKMELCPHAECTEVREHCHPDPESLTGLTPYYLARPKPVCQRGDCLLMVDHEHDAEGFAPRQRCSVIHACRYPHPHLHGHTGRGEGTMAEPQNPGTKVTAINGRRASGDPQTYTRCEGDLGSRWMDQFGAVWSWETLVEPRPWTDPRLAMPDFDEDVTSVRGPGWGTRTCQHCDHETFGGTESVTKDAMWEHLDGDDPDRRCPVLYPPPPPPAPSIGGYDAALYAAFVAGMEVGYDTDEPTESFWEWRKEWHGEWVAE